MRNFVRIATELWALKPNLQWRPPTSCYNTSGVNLVALPFPVVGVTVFIFLPNFINASQPAASPILTAWLSSVHQCSSLAWDKMSCIVQADLIIKRVNVREFDSHSSLPINSLQLVVIQSWTNFAVWAGAPSCWKRCILQLVWVVEFNVTLAFTLALPGTDTVIIIWVLRRKYLCEK